MRHYWGYGVGHTYSHVADGTRDATTGIPELELDEHGVGQDHRPGTDSESEVNNCWYEGHSDQGSISGHSYYNSDSEQQSSDDSDCRSSHSYSSVHSGHESEGGTDDETFLQMQEMYGSDSD